MITTNVIRRTLHLQLDNKTATGFMVDIDDRQYLVTARHFAESIKDRATLSIFHDGQWKQIDAQLVGHATGDVDITVLSLPQVLVHPSYVLSPDMGGLIYGQDVYILGYPYRMSGDVGDLNDKFPVPFVKRGIVSCIEHPGSGPQRVFLDCHNNPGFSGGPVVFREPNRADYKIASVISGYRYTNEPVFQGEEKLPVTYRYNTGIVVTYGIKHAVDLAKENPIGVPLSK